jgi:hypothetical protein
VDINGVSILAVVGLVVAALASNETPSQAMREAVADLAAA